MRFKQFVLMFLGLGLSAAHAALPDYAGDQPKPAASEATETGPRRKPTM